MNQPPPLQQPVSMLELTEALWANTHAGREPRFTPDEAFRDIREMLYLQRFQVISWLIMNGVAIPAHLVADSTHPKVGQQSVDK